MCVGVCVCGGGFVKNGTFQVISCTLKENHKIFVLYKTTKKSINLFVLFNEKNNAIDLSALRSSGWRISYQSLYFVHPSLELVPLFTGMRERSLVSAG